MITIISGIPGAGKTALMTRFALMHIKGAQAHRDLKASYTLIDRLNAGGFAYTKPSGHLVFADYTILAGAQNRIRSWECNGFNLGLYDTADDGNPTMFLPPASWVYLDEAQKYFNSRESKKLSDYVSRFYELHRHYRLNVYMTVQRPMLIDKNIRELVAELLYIEKLEHKKVDGRIVSSTWTCRLFTNAEAGIAYVDSGKKDAGASSIVKYSFAGNIFRHYESYAFFPAFIRGNEDRTDFDMRGAVPSGFSREEIEDFNEQHNYTVPQSYYKKSK